jgi:hypothetical protein
METFTHFTEYQKISLFIYKLRINGYPNARCTGQRPDGTFVFEGLDALPRQTMIGDFYEFDTFFKRTVVN